MAEPQWLLSAPATSILVQLPPADADPQPLGADAAPVKLALQELLTSGLLELDVVREGVMLTEATLRAGADPGDLPPALDGLYKSVRPFLPGALKKVLTTAHRRNPLLTTDVRHGARRELVGHGLIEERSVRRLGRRRAAGWTRTDAGDALAAEGARHLERLREAEHEVDRDSEGGLDALFAADEAAAVWEPIELEGSNRHKPHEAGTWLGGN